MIFGFLWSLEFKVPSVFISYPSNDQVKVERLAEALRQEEGIAVWLDTTNIYPGDDFLEEMKKGIRAADKIIICLSPSFNEKPPASWVKKELKMAMLRESKIGKSIIIPVRIKSGGSIPEKLVRNPMPTCRLKAGGTGTFPD
jgi:hypothetical protein